MNTENKNIMKISNLEIKTLKKDIKNIHLGVYPPEGRIRIAAPSHVDDEALRLLAISKLSWIKKQQKKFENQERQTKREYINGESHYFLGRRYLLEIIQDNKNHLMMNRNKIFLHIKNNSLENKKNIFQKHYRTNLKNILKEIIPKWEERLNVKINKLVIRKMKTKWGSCNSEKSNILLNLELAKKPLDLIEYVLVHEMTHLIERNHTKNFEQYLDYYLPNWKSQKEALNKSILSSYH